MRNRQTTAQSSTLAYGHLNFQALAADSTSVRAAEDRGAEITMSTTSLFERTSQICQNGRKHQIKYLSMQINQVHYPSFMHICEQKLHIYGISSVLNIRYNLGTRVDGEIIFIL